MLFVSEAESAALITHEIAYDAVRAALIAACSDTSNNFPAVLGHGSSPGNRFSIKAASTAELAGLKVGSYWPGNLDRGLPRHNSLILLFDQERGRIAVAMEAGVVNAYRTAAADAVATDLLARPESSTLAIFGAGNQASFECEALARVRPIRRIMVVARDQEKGEAMAADLRRDGRRVEVASAEQACMEADIIVTATPARAPLFKAEWVRPGTHLSSMGSDGPGKQELPPELFARAELYCDLPEQSRRIGEFQHAPADSVLTPIADVLLQAHPGRRSADSMTLFDSSGISLQDLYVARHLLSERESLRHRLPTGGEVVPMEVKEVP